jgi:hypothetical protein
LFPRGSPLGSPHKIQLSTLHDLSLLTFIHSSSSIVCMRMISKRFQYIIVSFVGKKETSRLFTLLAAPPINPSEWYIWVCLRIAHRVVQTYHTYPECPIYKPRHLLKEGSVSKWHRTSISSMEANMTPSTLKSNLASTGFSSLLRRHRLSDPTKRCAVRRRYSRQRLPQLPDPHLPKIQARLSSCRQRRVCRPSCRRCARVHNGRHTRRLGRPQGLG